MQESNYPHISAAQEKKTQDNMPEVLPIIPVVDMVMFPRMQMPIAVTQPDLVALLDEAMAADRMVGVVAIKKKGALGISDPEELYQAGTAAAIVKMMKASDSQAQMIVQGISRFRVASWITGKPYLKAKIVPFYDIAAAGNEVEALKGSLARLFSRMLEIAPFIPPEMAQWLRTVDDPGLLADVMASTMQSEIAQKQEVLEAKDVLERLRLVNKMAARQLEIMELEHKIHAQIKGDMDKTQRDFYLRQQLKAIQDELGEKDDSKVEVEEFAKKIEELNLPEQAAREAKRELNRLARMHPSSAEYTVASTYLDWITSLPWNESTQDNLDIEKAKKVLDADHFGLEKPKKRILEYLAVKKLKPDSKGPILCLVGPPGTGKTSLGRSVARALGRKFVRISLGGVRDEAEIRGHRRTYVGAMPGRIIQGIRRAGANNPVFMLDEIDKVGSDFRGDPSSALLEVLDPQQNDSFSDHYLDVAFDLSKVSFITTANILDTIPPALLDRMEVIRLAGYTAQEKAHIAKKYLIPRQRQENGLAASRIKIPQATVNAIISGYTREAGLRNLEREIASVCRGVARKVAEGAVKSATVLPKDLHEYLGPVRFLAEQSQRKSVPGVVTGLAWTQAGGDILHIESAKIPGDKGLKLTGQLGDVMKESAQAALSFLRSHQEDYGIAPEFFIDNQIHIHVPAGAIPKDGPSAGVTMLTAIASLATNRPVRPELAMTGEITLRGQVLPVGGIKEKVLAAHRAKIREIILPKANEKDMEDIPESVRSQISFHFADTMDEVLETAFKKPEKTKPAAKKPKKAGKTLTKKDS
jgi:ATP-dependent Lon protease